ncbi:hypothetical protein FSP39_004711 [Pinctada imbricata]|uniref:Uncharacterized protein n=1 Tax=Pinctada imbricata TaxID=66713 RepID=A0AA89BWU5_PINIB|nr:hypothetical protein FSP39_004711 [Pinctada imbricata]
MCISECQAVGKCWTVNYNLDHLSCEMNIDADQSNLVNDVDFVFVDIDSAVSDFQLITHYSVLIF